MPLLTLSDAPSPSMRRWFGLSLGVLMLLLGSAFRAWHPAVLGTAAAACAVLVAVYYAIPNTQLAVIRAWQGLTFPIAWTVGHVLLLTVYYIVLLPLALVLRARGHDPLSLRSQQRKTGWVDRQRPASSGKYFKQY